MSTLHIVASVLGYIGATLLFLQVVLGTRHVFSFFTDDTVLANKIHKYIGIYGTVLIFFHPLTEMMWQENSYLWFFLPRFSNETETHISFGRFALILLALLWVTSAIVRESIKWRPWKYVHLISFPIVFLVFVHTLELGSFFEDYLRVRVIWFIFFGLFIVSLLYRFLAWAAVTKNESRVLASRLQEESLLILTLALPSEMKLPRIGQHMYLQAKRFGSEHPFTVMDLDAEKREITFGMRTGGLFVNAAKEMSVGSVMYLDGPYGVFTKEGQNDEEKVIIAGGVGVTPFVRLARVHGKNATFLYANRKLSDALYHDELKTSVARYVDIVENYEGEKNGDVIVGRVDGALLQSILGNKLIALPYFICGSPMFISIMKKTLTDLGVKKENIFYEELGF